MTATSEQKWSQKLWKLYKMMFYLEKSKYNSMHYSMWLKKIASFFAVKHNLINLESNNQH